MKIECLDHGFVRLVSYTQPVNNTLPGGPVQKWTGDLEIVRNARTSYNADWRTGEEDGKDHKLIRYLYEHNHTTPFEAMVFTFEVQAPIFVFRQWHRHRTWSYNEVSARYTELPELFYTPEFEHIGLQSQKNKQGRETAMDMNVIWRGRVQEMIHKQSLDAFRSYHAMLELGVAREIARMVLPVNTYSRMFATVDLHNLFHFLELRLDEHAQYEIRVYAEALLSLARSVCPIAVGAFKDKFFAPKGG